MRFEFVGATMGRIVAIAGGTIESNKFINKLMLQLADYHKRNHLLFVGTASKDSEGYLENIRNEFSGYGCEVRPLNLVSKSYTSEEIDEILAWAGVIYIGGGDTFFMMQVWKKYDLDNKLIEIYKNDRAVLGGISAGAMCWFQYGHSDSSIFWNGEELAYGWMKGLLNIYPRAFCPHYEERKETLHTMMNEIDVPCLALESDTAFVEDKGKEYFVKCNEGTHIYLVQNTVNGIDTEEIKAVVL